MMNRETITSFVKSFHYKRFFSQLTLVLMVVLFPPAVAAWTSQDTVPGDTFYPIKRSLEVVILRFYSNSPSSKTAYQISLSDRRFKESTVLLQRRGSITGLSSLVSEVRAATQDLSKVTNPEDKAKLKTDLTEKINGYIIGLDQLKRQGNVTVFPTHAKTYPSPTPLMFVPLFTPTTVLIQPTWFVPPTLTPLPIAVVVPTIPSQYEQYIEQKLRECAEKYIPDEIEVSKCQLEVDKEAAKLAGGPGEGTVFPIPTLTLTPPPPRCPNAMDCTKIPAFADLARKQCEVDNENLLKNNCAIPTQPHSGGPQSTSDDEPTPSPEPPLVMSPTTIVPSNTPVPTAPPPPTISPTLPQNPAVQGVQSNQRGFCFFFLCF